MKWQFVALNSVLYLQLLSPSLKLKITGWMPSLYKQFRNVENLLNPPKSALTLHLSCNVPIKVALGSPVILVEDNMMGHWVKRKNKIFSVQDHRNTCWLAV